MRAFILGILILTLYSCGNNQSDQNELNSIGFDPDVNVEMTHWASKKFEIYLNLYPELEFSLGLRNKTFRFNKYSLEFFKEKNGIDEEMLKELILFDRNKLGKDNYYYHVWLLKHLRHSLKKNEYLNFQNPVNPISGEHLSSINIFLNHFPIIGSRDAVNYLNMIGQLKPKIHDLIDFIDYLERNNIILSHLNITRNESFFKEITKKGDEIYSHPVYKDFKGKIENISVSKKSSRLKSARSSIEQNISIPYLKLWRKIKSSAVFTDNSVGLSKLESGSNYYDFLRTESSNLTIDSINSILEIEINTLIDLIKENQHSKNKTISQFIAEDSLETYLSSIISTTLKRVKKTYKTKTNIDWKFKGKEGYKMYKNNQLIFEFDQLIQMDTTTLQSFLCEEISRIITESKIKKNNKISSISHLRTGKFSSDLNILSAFGDLGLIPAANNNLYYLNKYLKFLYLAQADIGVHHTGWNLDETDTTLKENSSFKNEEIHEYIQQLIFNPAEYLNIVFAHIALKKLKDNSQEAYQEKFNLNRFNKLYITSSHLPYSIFEQKLNVEYKK